MTDQDADRIVRRRYLPGSPLPAALPDEYPVEIGLAKSEAALPEARVAVSHLQAALDTDRLGTERLEREVHQTWSREQLLSELIARLPEAIGAMKVESCNLLATGADTASPLAKALVEIVTGPKTVDLGTIPQVRASTPPRPLRGSDKGARLV